jgi:hypothetical protein
MVREAVRAGFERITMKKILIHTMYLSLVLGLMYIVTVQNTEVRAQQKLIREMIHNPSCLMP